MGQHDALKKYSQSSQYAETLQVVISEDGGWITNAISMTQHQNCTKSNNQWLDIPVPYTTSQMSRHYIGLQPIFLTEKQQNTCWQRKNWRFMILDYHIFICAKICWCSACTKLQPSMAPARFPPFHFDAKENEVLISLNRCSMVGVGLGASLKGGNQIWGEKRILFYFQIIMS
jgi:hypothetical protein